MHVNESKCHLISVHEKSQQKLKYQLNRTSTVLFANASRAVDCLHVAFLMKNPKTLRDVSLCE